MGRKTPEFPPGRFLICEALDAHALVNHEQITPRQSPMPESLVVYDCLGAGAGDLIAISEGREAAAAFHPDRVPNDAYCAAILDRIMLDRRYIENNVK
jgi:microcompartment protein CcmK/EutM